MVLALDSRLHELRSIANFFPINTGPGIFRHTYFVATYRVSNRRKAQILSSPKLGNRSHIDEKQSFRVINESICCIPRRLLRGVPEPIKAAQQRCRQRPAGTGIRLCDWHMPDTWIVYQEPIRQVAFLIDNPDHTIEKGSWWGSIGARSCLLREHKCARECLVL